MTAFSIAWNRQRLAWKGRAPWMLEAILCERKLIEGKPAIYVVCRLARIRDTEIDDPDAVAREQFWHDARRKLGKLQRLTLRDVERIESLLAQKIPKVVELSTVDKSVRPAANPVTGPHQPLQTVLRAR